MKSNSVAAVAERAIVAGGRLVSIPRLVIDLRRSVPECEHTDEELAHLVAVIAVSQGRDLSFGRDSARAAPEFQPVPATR